MRPAPRQIMALVVLIALTVAGETARAADAPKAGKAGQYVDLSPAGVPVISHGRLVNYVFVTLRLTVRPGVDAMKLREKEPFFRDALVRLADRGVLNPPGDLNRLDDGAVKSKMMAEAARIAGPGIVTAVQVLTETPQRQVRPPSP